MLTDRKYDEEFADDKRPFLIGYSEEDNGFYFPDKHARFQKIRGASDLFRAMSGLDKDVLFSFLHTYVGPNLDYQKIERYLYQLSGRLLAKDWVKEIVALLEEEQ